MSLVLSMLQSKWKKCFVRQLHLNKFINLPDWNRENYITLGAEAQKSIHSSCYGALSEARRVACKHNPGFGTRRERKYGD
jgi:hypothetical protein